MTFNILYCESNTDGTVGGSHFSLLFLVENLDKNIFSPVVAFYQVNPLIPRFQQAGCRVLLIKKPDLLNFPQSFPWLRKLSRFGLLELVFLKPLLLVQKVINYFLNFVIPSVSCWKVIRREKIDIVHLNNTLLRPQEWILASLFTKAKVVAHERGINKHFPFQSRFWARYLKTIVCISNAVRTNLLKHGFPEHQLCRIYNGLDPEKFSVRRNKDDVLKELGIANGTPVIGIVGNIKEWKGQEILIRAMRRVREAFPKVKCLLVGDAGPYERPYLEKIQHIMNEEDLQDCVIFTGYRNDIADIVNAFDVLVHASLEPEPFGRVLLEGMALAKPVISTTIGSGPEIVAAGETGLLVQPGDDRALAQAITYLLTNHEKAQAMGKAGHDRLKRNFTISEHISRIDNIYRKLLT